MHRARNGGRTLGPPFLLVALVCAVFSALFLTGCANQTAQKRKGNDMDAVVIGSVTFYKDVLPILTSSRPGANYRCTVCHASYADYQQVSRPAVANAIVDSIAMHRMPLTGDSVTARDFEIIRAWVAGGLVAGQPIAAPGKTANP